MGYKANMSYEGNDKFVLLNRTKNKLNMISFGTFDKNKNSTYKRYKYITNLTDLVKYIND